MSLLRNAETRHLYRLCMRRDKLTFGEVIIMFRGVLLGITYNTWSGYRKAWNEAVLAGKLFDEKGRKITKIYQD